MAGNASTHGTTAGIGFGSVIAGLISWEYTHSILWTFLHVVFGWFYVIYSLIVERAHLM